LASAAAVLAVIVVSVIIPAVIGVRRLYSGAQPDPLVEVRVEEVT
jgi:hypothetical protein